MAQVELKPEHTGYLTNGQNGPILVHRVVRKLGNIDTVHVQGKDYPVQRSGARNVNIWATCGPALKWYKLSIDGIHEECETRADAELCCTATIDYRKHPIFKEIAPGFLEYIPPRGERTGRYIGTYNAVLLQGFEDELQEFEEEQQVYEQRHGERHTVNVMAERMAKKS
jgi:hypothetical protein